MSKLQVTATSGFLLALGISSLAFAQKAQIIQLDSNRACKVRIERPVKLKGQNWNQKFAEGSSIYVIRSASKNPDSILFSSSEPEMKGFVFQGKKACLVGNPKVAGKKDDLQVPPNPFEKPKPDFLKPKTEEMIAEAKGIHLGSEWVGSLGFNTFSQSLTFTSLTGGSTEALVNSILGGSVSIEKRFRSGGFQGRAGLGAFLGFARVANDGAAEAFVISTTRALMVGGPLNLYAGYVLVDSPTFLFSGGLQSTTLFKFQRISSASGSISKDGFSILQGVGLGFVIQPGPSFGVNLGANLNEFKFSRLGFNLGLDFMF